MFTKLRAQLNYESKLRSQEFAKNLYFRKRYIPVVLTFLLASLTLILYLIIPPGDFAKDIRRRTSEFREFKDGFVYFSKSITPPKDFPQKNAITLPFRATDKLPGYDLNGIWFEFQVNLSEEELGKGKRGILVPPVWGDAKIYVNGELRDYGRDLFSVLPVSSPNNFIQIRSDVSGTGRTNPITATFPFVTGEIDALRHFVRIMYTQLEVHIRAIAIYCLAIVVFGMLFLAYPRKPELLCFIVLMTSSLANAILVTANDNNYAVVKIFWAQQTLLLAMDFATNLAMFVFAMYFLRAHPLKIKEARNFVIIASLTVGVALTHLLYNWLGANSYRQIGHLVVNASFLVFQGYFVLPRLALSLVDNTIPAGRKVACGLVSLTILFFYSINILDYFSLLSAVTTVYSNGLILNLTLAVTVAFEVSRAEHNQLVLGSMLPKEVKETLHLSDRQSEQSGYVILVDAIGYSSDRARFDNSVVRASYIDALARKMLRPLNDLDLGDVSILSCTGDGIYCAIRGPATLDNLKKAMSFAESVTSHDGAAETIGFRAAIGYGKYGVKVIDAGRIRKEFVSGNVLNDLSRVIGSKTDKESVRVLVSSEIENFLSGGEREVVIDKHGFHHHFVSDKKIKRAA